MRVPQFPIYSLHSLFLPLSSSYLLHFPSSLTPLSLLSLSPSFSPLNMSIFFFYFPLSSFFHFSHSPFTTCCPYIALSSPYLFSGPLLYHSQQTLASLAPVIHFSLLSSHILEETSVLSTSGLDGHALLR